MEWLTEEEYLAITTGGDRKVLNEVLTRVYGKAIEQALCHIPMMVAKLSRKVEVVNRLTKAYFEENPEFLKFMDVTLKTIQSTEIEFTGLSFEEVLAKAKPLIERKIANLKGGENGGS